MRPLSARAEGRAVLGAVLLLVGGSAALARARAVPGAAEVPPQPWQRSFLELPAEEQLRYRLLREAMLEAEALRERPLEWPAPTQLAAQGLWPFADDPLQGTALAWTLRQERGVVHYLGLPRDGGALRWLVVFLEPEQRPLRAPGEPPPPQDEEHHTLFDGTPVHAQLWTQPDEGPRPDAVGPSPQDEGWTQRVGQGGAAP